MKLLILLQFLALLAVFFEQRQVIEETREALKNSQSEARKWRSYVVDQSIANIDDEVLKLPKPIPDGGVHRCRWVDSSGVYNLVTRRPGQTCYELVSDRENEMKGNK